ncbi:MAG: sigma factor-like helix-turn-helix DNA-binding protein, partial [Thermoleophilaceae bacterium]
MPIPRNSPRTLVAARMYYLEHRTQAEVAHHLGVSRPTVS